MNDNISILEGFVAMSRFLERYYHRTQSDDLASLLGDLQFREMGKTADPAAWVEWIDCVKQARIDNKQSSATRQTSED